jgi:hypothetical protein
MFSMMISFALLCLSNCSNSEPSKPSDSNLSIECLKKAKKPLVEVEVFESEKLAILTNSNSKTHIHLDEITLNCAATDPRFKINHIVDMDTLKLDGVYYNGGLAKCNCLSSLDLTIESIAIGDNIKYLSYTDHDQPHIYTTIFPVKYE